MEYEQLKDRLKGQVWDKYVEITTCIFYSSIYCEEKRDKQYGFYFWIVYLSMATPAFLALLIKVGVIESMTIILVIAITSLLIPVILRYRDKSLIYSIFGFYNQEINALLTLNKRLDLYRDSLLTLFYHAENIKPSKNEIEKIEGMYKALCLEYQDDVKKHDEMTGKIDERIQCKAQDKTKQYIQTISAYE